ncbi:hypothetical protein [Bosea sp. (in: a-proteobacteria)]|uniref:hypothetical protein n=1 Tax=Bosea sp. (in: a-proteobacteria) TaxID=1871050 RepID=UPI002FCC91F0
MMLRPALICSLAAFVAAAPAAIAAPAFVPLPAAARPLPVEPARSMLKNFLDALSDDDDVHDDHYDWKDYRNSTSRKERIRDYYEMQRQDQKDYWKGQKEMQKRAIKAQRGW